MKLNTAQRKYSTFSRELLAIYLSIRHFRHLIEGRDFTVFTDHKPLTDALHVNTEKYTLRDTRQLDYISQFTSDIRYNGLMDLPVPQNLPSLRWAIGMFSHYFRWISNFSEKLHPPTKVTRYPLTKEQTEAFKYLKQEIAKSSLVAIDSSLPFEIETDASAHAIAASLTQNGRPVAFFSRTLTSAEQKHSSVEK